MWEAASLQRPLSCQENADGRCGARKADARTNPRQRSVPVILRDVGAGAELPRGWFEQLLSDYVSAVQAHMEMEEKDFFPQAADRLTDKDWQEVDALVEKLRGPRIAKTLAEARQWLEQPYPAPPDPNSRAD